MSTSPRQEAHLLRIQQTLRQTAPSSSHGPGRIVLYRCPVCHHPWLADGNQVILRPDRPTLVLWQTRLQADLEHLPLAVCRLCGFASGRGVLQVDEYDAGAAYGFNWEGETPSGAHLLAMIAGKGWLERQSSPAIMAEALSPIVLAQEVYGAVCRWFADELRTRTHFPCVHVLSEEDSLVIAQGNPPGHGALGTQNWRWKGGVFLLECPPLHDEVLLMLGIALPEEEQVQIDRLLFIWQQLAALIVEDQPEHDDHDEQEVR
jgi:hypothetical protein